MRAAETEEKAGLRALSAERIGIWIRDGDLNCVRGAAYTGALVRSARLTASLGRASPSRSLPIVNRLSEASAEEGCRVYAFIGRETFSSAVLNAIELEQEVDAVFVGEPSGCRPNHFGEVRVLELPATGLNVSSPPDTDALLSEIAAPPSLAAYRRWEDPAMTAVGAAPSVSR